MSQRYIAFSESFCKILIIVLDRLIISKFITCIIILNNEDPHFQHLNKYFKIISTSLKINCMKTT